MPHQDFWGTVQFAGIIFIIKTLLHYIATNYINSYSIVNTYVVNVISESLELALIIL